MNAVDKDKEFSGTFQWSLKPLFVLANLIGLPLNGFTRNKRRRRFSIIFKLIIPISCCFVLMGNLVINGPQKLFSFDALKEKLRGRGHFESPFGYFKANPQGLIILVKDVMLKWFFAAVPLVHLVFFVTVLFTRKWKDVWTALDDIQKKMNLNEEFHRKCRKHCLLVILVLILVGQ